MERSADVRVASAFSLCGARVALDHGYVLPGALRRHLGDLRGADGRAVRPLPGSPMNGGLLRLPAEGAVLTLRLAPAKIPRVLPLSGRTLDLDGHRIQVGPAQPRALAPAANLESRMVVIQGALEQDLFVAAVRRAAAALEVDARIEVGRRRVMTIGEPRHALA